MRKIKLSQGLYTSIDDEDYGRVSQYKWCASLDKKSPNKESYYALRNIITPEGKRTTLALHRFLMGDPSGMCIDHINHNTLDNRKANLRIVTQRQNCYNSRMVRENKSGYKGVTRSGKKWTAIIGVNNNKIYLGSFLSPKKASLAYNKAAKEHFGEASYSYSNPWLFRR